MDEHRAISMVEGRTEEMLVGKIAEAKGPLRG
jgi:hypothetical protein